MKLHVTCYRLALLILVSVLATSTNAVQCYVGFGYSYSQASTCTGELCITTASSTGSIIDRFCDADGQLCSNAGASNRCIRDDVATVCCCDSDYCNGHQLFESGYGYSYMSAAPVHMASIGALMLMFCLALLLR